MKIGLLIVAALAAPSAATAQETYKCKAGGGYVYQDRPCQGVKYPAGAPVVTPIPSASSGASAARSTEAIQPNDASPTAKAAPTELERQKAYLDGRAKERRVDDLKRQIELQEQTIGRTKETMDAELNRIRYQKQSASNNLAGATWEQSLATEMQAVTERYNGELAYQRSQLKDLQDQLAKAK